MPIERNTRDMGNPQFWDSWWEERISKRRTAMFMFPIVEAPMIKYGGTYVDVVNSDSSDTILAMIVSLRHLLGWIVGSFRSREDLVLENLALRRQLLALHAQRPRTRLTALHIVAPMPHAA